MNRKAGLIAAPLLALLLCLPTALNAQTTRVAYVDIDRVTDQSDRINKAMNNVSNRVEAIQKELEEKRQRLADLKLEIRKGEGVLAESELKKKRDEVTKLEKETVDLEYEGRRELQKLDTTLFEPMIKTIVLAIEEVAKEKNVDLVLRGEAVIYGADVADLTNDVVKKLNSPSFNPDAEASTESAASEDEDATTTSEPSDRADSNSSSASGSSSNEAVLPQIPLRRRPVDRQSE